ncbi:MAG: helix-hairpin-helix domain-containing protein [Bacilli bacterium]|nr:helix-hairpin-helix domain-containing protein [Bacilli bacterium]
MIKVIIVGIIITIVGLFTLGVVNSSMQATDNAINGYPTAQVQDENSVKVSITGQVNYTGSYYISPEATLGDLITKAGGVTNEADETCYNTSLLIKTHTSFYIAPKLATNNMCIDTTVGKVNLNSANSDMLIDIGFTSSQAPSIVTYREENGSYEALEDIMNVKGVGSATFEKVKNKICLTDPKTNPSTEA